MSKCKSIIDLVQQIYNTKDSISLHEPQFFGNEKLYLNDVIESTTNTVDNISTGIGKASDNTKEFISSAANSFDKNRQIAKTVFNKLMSNSDKLIEAFVGIFVAYLFKILVLPIIIFTLLLSIVRNSFRFKEN